VIWLQSLLSAAQFKRLFNFLLVGAALIAGPGVIVLMLTGKLQWSGRSLTLLDPTYASKYIPIIASVGEHQPTAWGSFIMNLGPVQLLAPLGLYYCFHRLDESYLFMIIYSTFSWYFSGIMVRLLLTLAPAACFLSAVGISAFVDCISIMSSNIQNNVIEQDDNAADTATNPITADSSSTVSASSIFTGANQKRNKRAKHTPTPPTSRTSNSHAVNDEDWFAEAETICKERIRFKYPKERVQLDTLHGVPSSLALLLVAVCVSDHSFAFILMYELLN
jgi:dolichyl-diphosphooligosaccharide--protein glycosyltransferase